MLRQLIYISQPFGYDAATLANILVAARRNNSRDGVTGALICRHDIYLQLLEGPTDAVVAAFERIVADDRHLDITALRTTDVATRMFPRWDMLDDPARSWLWSPAAVAAGAVAEAGADGVAAVFARVAAELGSATTACPDGPNA
ncbi:BLUF domain-containing protein [Polymorphobacter sp. PAMC 29334]|uniref:BLUF domain-containing protein n=1 Tax=Polymorphobacter sp. PAMC 29334 TaxID=2862331 RepID=UPI001C67C200|nr:BLUF domain-containing protein [Polymorphobacter sp. PAMC 29334]QYE33713.1 BLUF domain-containing protein [Polymorphobacter sp. PAMC 29334]